MTRNDGIQTIEIVGWKAFNARRDVKHSSWFRMEHKLAFDPEWHHVTAQELWVWVWLLSFASLKNKGTLEVSDGAIAEGAKVTLEVVLSAKQLLISKGCVTVTVRKRTARVTSTSRTRSTTDRTDRTDEQDGQTPAADAPGTAELDFESLYRKYPRKVSKQDFVKRCSQVITTPEDFAGLSGAIDRYKANLIKNRTEERYVLHGTTFIENRKGEKPYTQPWRDWLDPDTGTTDLPAASGIDWTGVGALS